jgi:Transmembrane domain of unknown function (DUF3566)
MYRIHSIKVARSALTFATVLAFIYVVMMSILFSMMFVFPSVSGLTVHQGMHLPTWKEIVGLLLILPPLVFVVVWIFFYPLAALFCFLYNQVAKITGGIEFSSF